MRKPLIIFAAICFLTTNIVCTKPATDQSKTSVNTAVDQSDAIGKTVSYIIKQGGHYCKPNPVKLTSKSKLVFTAVFDSSCIYQTVDPLNQDDINKLYGFSDCNDRHLENSARVGWRWSDGALRIFGFVHNNGEMIYQEITTAQIDSVITCSITCLDTQYKVVVNGKKLLLPRNCSGDYTRYMLYPYFGGDEAAPHDIKIQITDL